LVVRILLLILVIQAVSLGVLSSIVERTLEHYAQGYFAQLLKPIEAQVNSVLAPALAAGKTDVARQLARHLVDNNPLLSYVVVDDARDRPLIRDGRVPADLDSEENRRELPPDPLRRGPMQDVELGIHAGARVVGHVHLGIRLSPLQEFQRSLTGSALRFALGYLALSMLLIGLVIWHYTRRLRELDQAARAVSAGRLEQVSDTGPRDEVGRLARSFNGMLQALAEQRQLQAREQQRLRAIADYTFAWEIWLDPEGRLVWTNPSARRLTGYGPEELKAMPDFPRPLAASQDGRMRVWQQLLDEPSGNGLECTLRRKDGQQIQVALYWQPIIDEQGRQLGKRASFVDVTEKHRAQEFLKESLGELQASETRQHELLLQSERQQARFRALLSAMNLGILFETPDRRIEYINPAFEEMWALDDPPEKLIGRPVAEVLEHSRHLFARPSNCSPYVLQVENTHEISERFEIELADGRILTQVSYPVHDNEDRGIGRLWLYEDVTHERQTAEQLIYLAERDSLTGLFNRHRFQIEMERMISMAQRYGHQFALLYFDLDEFKLINDTYGHREGDTVLTRIAGELARVVRKNDIFARLGGDEFAIVTLIDTDMNEIKLLAQRIVSAVARVPFRFRNQNIRMTTSVGISVYPDMASDTDSLVAQADAAMYQAKAQGKNTWSIYDQRRDASEALMAHMNWGQRIEHALENDLFQLHYQGVYRVEDHELAHLEALVRLRDPQHNDKLYMPGQFIPIAEKSGKILAIDQWVLRQVIHTLGEHPGMPPVAVNISGRSFDDPSLPQRIRQWLAESGVAPERLLIELTETAAVSDIQDAQRFIEALHQTGCTVCLDDFGSGFSSFAYLKHITADVLKIDGQFIHDLPNNPENQIFLRAMLDVATGLRKTTIAEFVDSEAVLEMLRHFGVDLAQGYYLDKPVADHPAIPSGAGGESR
jgi:diguanylate cyclase (GGDEF)-like protein/PAS domain S-box-containing protein